MDYRLPTYRQIMYGWKVKPVARNVALVLRDFAERQMEDNENASKVTIAVNKLSKLTDATDDGVNSALDELQSKGFVESNRPRQEDRNTSPQRKQRKPYYFRLRPGRTEHYKKRAKWADVVQKSEEPSQ